MLTKTPDDALSVMLILLGLVLTVFALTIPLSYLLLRLDLGKESAKEQLISRWPILVIIFLLFVLLFPGVITLDALLPATSIDLLFAALALSLTFCVWGYVLTYPLRKRRAGLVLVDIGPPRSTSLLMLSILQAVMAILPFIQYLTERDKVERIFYALFWLSLAACTLWSNYVARAQITERGLFHTSLIGWARLHSFKPAGAQDDILSLQIAHHLPLVGLLGHSTLRFLVPSELCGLVNRELSARVPQTTAQA